MHSKKGAQYLHRKSINMGITIIHTFMKRKYNYFLSPIYKRFHLQSHIWHTWSEDTKKDHVKKMQNYLQMVYIFRNLQMHESNLVPMHDRVIGFHRPTFLSKRYCMKADHDKGFWKNISLLQ